jgi:hypothetical protein
VNPRAAFFGVPPGRSRDVMQALCIVSEELSRSTFNITPTEIAVLSSVERKNVPRHLLELSAAGYLNFTAATGYRTTYSISLIEQQLRESTRLTMSRVREVLKDLNMTHLEASSKAPPGENMPHHESSLPTTANMPHLESSSPNSPHHESSLLAGKEEGGRGVVKGELLSINQRKSLAFTEINNREKQDSSSGFHSVEATNARPANDVAPRPENQNNSSSNMPHHESSSIEDDFPILESFGKQFIQMYPRKSAGMLTALLAFRDAAIAVHEKHTAEGERPSSLVDAALYILGKGRAYERIHEDLTEEAKGWTVTAANWLSQGRYDWPEWQWKAQGGAARGNNGRNTTPEAFDLQAALLDVRERYRSEGGGDSSGVLQAEEALREDSGAGAHGDVAGVANGTHAAGAVPGVRGGAARRVLPNGRRPVEVRTAR